MRALVLLATLAVLAATAPAAAAQSFSVPTGLPADPPSTVYGGGSSRGTAGPALAGDRVLWLEERGRGAVLLAARADGTRHQVLALPPHAVRGGRWQRLQLHASGDRAVVARTVTGPAVGDHALELLSVDLVTGATAAIDGCFGDAECATCRAGAYWPGYRLHLSGALLGVSACGRSTVLDLATGATKALDAPLILSLAGPRAAVYVPDADSLVDDQHGVVRLIEWSTGASIRTLLRIASWDDPAERHVAVGQDGTATMVDDGNVVAVAPDGRRRTVRRPGPGEHAMALEAALTGGLLAEWRVERTGEGDYVAVRVSRPDGTAVRQAGAIVDGVIVADQPVGSGWAAGDGRVAWGVRPCAQTILQVWDLATAPPPPTDEPCGIARLSAKPVRLTRGGRLSITATCPPVPAQGCAARLSVELRAPGSRRKLTTTWGYELEVPAGATRTVHVGTFPRARLRRHPRLVAHVRLGVEGPEHRERSIRIPVRR